MRIRKIFFPSKHFPTDKMLQRIQTLYLTAALICTGLLFYFPVWDSGDATGFATYGAGSHALLFILTIILGAVQFISIFLFRNRKWQTNFCWLALLLTVSYISIFLIIFITENDGLKNFIKGIKWAALLPMLIILFKALAIRNIQKDEALIRSMNRLR